MKKSFLIKLFLLLAVCVLAMFSMMERIRTRQASSVVHAAGLLPKISLEDLSEIELSWNDRFRATLIRNGDKWYLKERDLYPADQRKVREFILALASLRPLKVLSPMDPGALEALRVVPKSSGKNTPGVQVRLKDRKGARVLNLVMGIGHYINTDRGQVASHQIPDGRYLAVYGNDPSTPPSVILVAPIFENYHPYGGSWVAMPDFSNLPGALEIRFRLGDQSVWHLIRNSSTVPFSDASSAKMNVDHQAVSSIYSLLMGRFLQDVRNDVPGKTPGKPFADLRIRMEDGSFRRIEFYRGEGSNHILVRFRAEAPAGAAPGTARAVESFNRDVENRVFDLNARQFNLLYKSPFEAKEPIRK